MKQVMIVALVCLNIALVAALVYSVNEPVANAQARGNADYMLVTGKMDYNTDAVFVFDLVQQKLLAFEPDYNKNFHVQILAGRNLKGDFSGKD